MFLFLWGALLAVCDGKVETLLYKVERLQGEVDSFAHNVEQSALKVELDNSIRNSQKESGNFFS